MSGSDSGGPGGLPGAGRGKGTVSEGSGERRNIRIESADLTRMSQPRGTQFPPGSDMRPPAFRSGRGRKIRLISITAVLVLLAGLAGAYAVANHLTGNIHRIPNAFRGLNNGNQPMMPPASRGSMTILLAGSDIRSAHLTTGAGAGSVAFQPGLQRSDILMLVHIDASRHRASFVSIPRDSWVHVPGHGMMKINAALSLGGPPLMIKTVEDLTNVRINHFALIDFWGFENLVRAVGGVSVRVIAPTSMGTVHFRRGVNNLTPVEALAFVRQRFGLPLGDLDRIQRQQNLLRAILTKISAEHLPASPVRLYDLLDALTHAVSVDSTFTTATMRSLALRLSSLRGGDITFLTAPWRGFGVRDGQAIVNLDQGECASLWQAVRHDAVGAWVKRYPSAETPAVTY